MTLIEIFTEYVLNKKSLKDYVEVRKTIPTRGEFNDETLCEAEECLQRLKKEDPEVYDEMYKTLDEYFARDTGHMVEYPINFVKEILKIYQCDIPAQKICDQYKRGLDHHCQDS